MKQYRQPGVSFEATEAVISVWAPGAKAVALVPARAEAHIPLQRGSGGYWEGRTGNLRPGDTYRFALDEGDPLPDPASLKQPEGVHGASEAVDLSRFRSAGNDWNNIPLSDYIIYEIHTGTFSAAGTFSGIADRLDELVELGVTAIEIMPVAAFPGARNWGYDGVFPFAAHADYGGPEELIRLVDAAHAKGVAVILDVVYNHLGPEGNYFGAYGPYFTEKYKTPWGAAINFDDAGCDAVREYIITNALMWLRDFRIDALRLDAVHAIKDFGVKHILEEIGEAVDELETETGRRYYLIVENDLNDPKFIRSTETGGYGMDGQWIDEFHHALRVAAGQPQTGYYSDFDGLGHLAKAYRDAYVYDGQYSPHRDKHFGAPATGATGEQFVVFSQNHDQVGNRMLGERTSTLLSFGLQRVLAASVMLSPFLPMLFMGEEWAEPAPFQYFISHSDPALIEAVRKGRKAEFAAFQAEGEAPDPQDEQTFLRCKLDPALQRKEPHASMRRFYKELIRLRKAHPALGTERDSITADARPETGLLRLQRTAGDRGLICWLNFSTEARDVALPDGARLLLDSAAAEWGDAPEQQHLPLTIQPESCLIYEYDV